LAISPFLLSKLPAPDAMIANPAGSKLHRKLYSAVCTPIPDVRPIWLIAFTHRNSAVSRRKKNLLCQPPNGDFTILLGQLDPNGRPAKVFASP
jgi:hypothetical protein